MARQGGSQRNDGAHILSRVRTIVKHDERIVPRPHCKLRMQQRNISWKQIVDILKGNFSVFEQPWPNPAGEWELTVEGSHSGDRIRIGIALKEDSKGELVAVLTAIKIQRKRRVKRKN